MRCELKRTLLYVVCACAVSGLLAAAGRQPAKVELRLKPGKVVTFAVKRTSSIEGSSSRGEFKSKGTSTIEYRIALSEKKESGEVVLNVSYGAAKVNVKSSRGEWTFDSQNPTGDDPATTYVKGILGKTFTVTVSGNAIKEIRGFPEREEGRFNVGRMFFSAFGMRRDLNLILSTPVLGKVLKKGSIYAPPPREAAAQGMRRFRGFGLQVAYCFEGIEQKGRVSVATFSLKAAPPQEGARESSFKSETDIKGSALIVLRDGLPRRVNLRVKSKTEGERQGQSFKFTRTLNISVRRVRATRAGGPKGRRRAKKAAEKT